MSRVRCDSSRSVSASSAGVIATRDVSSSAVGFRLVSPEFKRPVSPPMRACRTGWSRAGILEFSPEMKGRNSHVMHGKTVPKYRTWQDLQPAHLADELPFL